MQRGATATRRRPCRPAWSRATLCQMVTVTLVIAGCPAQVPASVLPGRAEVRPAADGQGLSFGEHEGGQVRTALHGGLVQAVRPVVMARVWELSAVQSLWHLLS